MSLIIVSIALATICFTYNGNEECNPVLLGKNNATPTGQYTLSLRTTNIHGYGGNILQFHETETDVYAIHRVWMLNPKQQRMQRLQSENVNDRYISSGCINVDPIVYDKLVDCCSTDTLIIK